MEKALINAEIIEDKIGIQVDKAKATLKIDVVDAIIDALYQAMYHFEDFGLANDKSKQVDLMTSEQVKEWFESDESGLLGDNNDKDHLHTCGEYLHVSSWLAPRFRITSTPVENTYLYSFCNPCLEDHLHTCGEYDIF